MRKSELGTSIAIISGDSGPQPSNTVPANAITTDAGDPITTDAGDVITTD